MLNEPSSENNKRDVREDITDWSRHRDALHQYGAGTAGRYGRAVRPRVGAVRAELVGPVGFEPTTKGL